VASGMYIMEMTVTQTENKSIIYRDIRKILLMR